MQCLVIVALTALVGPLTSRASLNHVEAPRELCARCRRPPQKHGRSFCICEHLPPEPISLADTRIVVLQHPAEAKKTIASVPLIPLCVQPFSVFRGNHFDATVEPVREALEAGDQVLLLFPGPGAISLDEPAADDVSAAAASLAAEATSGWRPRDSGKVVLVLIDGTWTQARHMMRHSPELAQACTHVMFERRADAIIDPLRREPAPHCTSTLEACAHALRLVDPSEQAQAAADHMEAALRAIVATQLSMVGFQGSEPRRVDRKRRTWNRKLYRSDAPCKTAPQMVAASALASLGDRVADAPVYEACAVRAGGEDASGHATVWTSNHHGAPRVVYRRDTASWLREAVAAASAGAAAGADEARVALPAVFDIVSGLPDISEVRPRLAPAAYEAWCIAVVRDMLTLLPPERVAIFYQTPGRYSGEDGSWLDKQYLVTAGARAAGAKCVWQKVVLFHDSVGRRRGGTRAGWVTLLCFSKRHRVPRDHTTVDVLADRGHMAYAHATGEDACAAAVEYCRDVSAAAAAAAAAAAPEGSDSSEVASERVAADEHGCSAAAPTPAAVPVVDPFCGYGSVLAVANAYGLPAIGLDVSLKCCARAAAHTASQELVDAQATRRDS